MTRLTRHLMSRLAEPRRTVVARAASRRFAGRPALPVALALVMAAAAACGRLTAPADPARGGGQEAGAPATADDAVLAVGDTLDLVGTLAGAVAGGSRCESDDPSIVDAVDGGTRVAALRPGTTVVRCVGARATYYTPRSPVAVDELPGYAVRRLRLRAVAR